MTTCTIQHTAAAGAPYWYHLESAAEPAAAIRRARSYALDNGGYVCVKDGAGNVIFGTDPAQLDRAILSGINRDFPRETARRLGCAS